MTQLRIGIIGGSGVDEALGAEQGQREFPDTPFGKPSAPITLTRWQGVEVAVLQRHGVGHVYPPSRVPFRANIFAMKLLGVTHIVATGATGALRESMTPGDVVVPDQIIDKTYKRDNTFYEQAAVHVELADPFCPVTRRWLLEASKSLTHLRVHDGGTYVCMEGPAFSTRAESHMHRSWQGDLIGMTAMPEARLAREAEIAYALVALPTDYDCWRTTPSHEEQSRHELLMQIIGNLKRASASGLELIKAALADTQMLRDHPSPAHDALQMAIWSDKKCIDPGEVQRLAPLWGRYFGG